MKWSAKDSSVLTVEDVDWITSDKPVLLTSDGCLRVYDLKLVLCHTAIQIKELAGMAWARAGVGTCRYGHVQVWACAASEAVQICVTFASQVCKDFHNTRSIFIYGKK